jgi:hypothetical protein
MIAGLRDGAATDRIPGHAFRRKEAEKGHQLLRRRKPTYIANLRTRPVDPALLTEQPDHSASLDVMYGQILIWENQAVFSSPRRLAGETLDGLGRTAGAMPSEKLQLLVLQGVRRPKELFKVVARMGRKLADILEIRFER